MSIYSLNTASGGLIELQYVSTRFHGQQLMLHVDQTANINNGEGDCSIVINDGEIKDLISLLNGYLTAKNGIPYVVLAEHLANPAIKIDVEEFAKNADLDPTEVSSVITAAITSAIENPNNDLTADDFIN